MNDDTMRLRLRPATLDDAGLLLAWRNEPSTRAASHDGSPIGIDQHLRWLEASLADASRELYIAECDGVAVGTVRTDRDGQERILSWTVSPAKRGCGIGKAMVRLLAETIADPIRAEIRSGNTASIRIAEAAGLRFVREQGGILHYRRAAVAEPRAMIDAAPQDTPIP